MIGRSGRGSRPSVARDREPMKYCHWMTTAARRSAGQPSTTRIRSPLRKSGSLAIRKAALMGIR
jgi:hypothetical protein